MCGRFSSSEGGRAVDKVVKRPEFWLWNHAIDAITCVVDELRGWCRACPCHEAQCVEYARRHQLFPCLFKGCRGPQLRGRIDALAREIQEHRAGLTLVDCGGEHAVFAALQVGFDRLAGHASLKRAFLDEIPWCVWQARSPAGAATFLRKYDERMADPATAPRMHRVGQMLAGDPNVFPSSLRPSMEARARGDLPIQPAFDAHLRSYEYTTLDECPAEGEHRHASAIRQHSHLYIATEMRREQHIREFEAAVRGGSGKDFLRGFVRSKHDSGCLIGWSATGSRPRCIFRRFTSSVASAWLIGAS